MYQEQIIEYKSEKQRYDELVFKAEEERKKIEEQRRVEEEKRQKEEERRLAWEQSGFTHAVEYTLKVSYYTNFDSKLEGGQYDRKGVLLTDHEVPVVAMNKSIPYGSFLVVDEPVNGHTVFKIVDCGGAMGIKNGVANVDVFIANKTSDWLSNNTNKQTVSGKVYYKGE